MQNSMIGIILVNKKCPHVFILFECNVLEAFKNLFFLPLSLRPLFPIHILNMQQYAGNNMTSILDNYYSSAAC